LHDDEVRVYDTDPTRADTDQGGLTDAEEVLFGTKPREPDSDSDGVRDGVKLATGSDPLEAQSVPTALVHGTNAREVLVLNPDTGQATVLGLLPGGLHPATGLPSQIFKIASSPDGRTLYAWGFDGVADRLYTLDPDTGAILTTVDFTMVLPFGSPIALGVDATGALLATVCCRVTAPVVLGRLDPTTGVLTLLDTPTGFHFLGVMQFDPDFRTLYIIAGGQIPQILVSLDPATGQATPIARIDLPTRADALAFTADDRLLVAGSDRNLYQLDPRTGASTLIGPTGVDIGGMSLRVLR
jgi:hypothetical protein